MHASWRSSACQAGELISQVNCVTQPTAAAAAAHRWARGSADFGPRVACQPRSTRIAFEQFEAAEPNLRNLGNRKAKSAARFRDHRLIDRFPLTISAGSIGCICLACRTRSCAVHRLGAEGRRSADLQCATGMVRCRISSELFRRGRGDDVDSRRVSRRNVRTRDESVHLVIVCSQRMTFFGRMRFSVLFSPRYAGWAAGRGLGLGATGCSPP